MSKRIERLSKVLTEKRKEYCALRDNLDRLRSPHDKIDSQWFIACLLATVFAMIACGEPIIALWNKNFWSLILIWSIYTRQTTNNRAKYKKANKKDLRLKWELKNEISGLDSRLRELKAEIARKVEIEPSEEKEREVA